MACPAAAASTRSARASTLGSPPAACRWRTRRFLPASRSSAGVANFVRMQSNGAVMLREAIENLAAETDIDVVCSLHNAIYAQCPLDRVEETKARVIDAMARAARWVTGPAVEVGVEAHVYTHETGYGDPRGDRVLGLVSELLAEIEASPDAGLRESVAPKPRKTKAAAAAADNRLEV